MNRSIQVCCWNVCGLGDREKCGDVLAGLLSSTSDLVLLQEMKLAKITQRKLYSFLPRHLTSFVAVEANGSSAGIRTAWNENSIRCIRSSSTSNTLTTTFQMTSSDLKFSITNVYAPSTPENRNTFLDELRSISPTPGMP